jgi:signal transduction histidine kinase
MVTKDGGSIKDAHTATGKFAAILGRATRRPWSNGTERRIDGAQASRTARELDLLWERLLERERRGLAHACARDRLRIAADVHDLVMQDIAMALASIRVLVDDPSQAACATTAATAAERALDGARRIVGGLTEQDREAVVQALESCVLTAANHTRVSFDANDVRAGAQPDCPTLDALIHIGREAVTNAVKHADATSIEVILAYADEWRLRVRDDGLGFDPTAQKHVGFGLWTMRRSAESIGGSLRIATTAGAGTVVEAVLP